MKHVKAFVLKFISCLVLLYIILGLFYGMSFGMVFLTSLTLAATSYILGDFLVLPRTNNFIATITDYVLAFFVIWSLSISLTLRENIVTMSLVAAAGVALFEIIFHRYMANQIITNMKTSPIRPRQLQFQTEASEELTPSETDLKIDEDKSNRGEK
ncbi:YndM family protein [Bacillus sp. DTU_2020_1000418_1_SI_GHA_SEK_038]|uniref:YndM family protein n=1 Tax=Bacillus sp. DTU_2020_1000418_1_SI_GHA_SEK_038 TaxID=3077585 RepID=UPI0028EC698B|nr:YndM family protein [Bacillus sp. DTU_2020_1000418_1_SI_GHA_SEK_038]WNS73820.1 YndM family protein [Bacillus sp. DTU_2020_1000418_1_SI_GHA_SEK_038]